MDQLENSCGCDLSAKHVAKDRLTCGDSSTDRVIFTGVLIGTKQVESDKILERLQQWTKTESTILVQGVQLKIAECLVRLEEAEKPKCVPLYSPAPLTERIGAEAESGGLGFPIYIAIAVVVLLLLICITTILIIVIVLMMRRQKKRCQQMIRSVATGAIMYGLCVGLSGGYQPLHR